LTLETDGVMNSIYPVDTLSQIVGATYDRRPGAVTKFHEMAERAGASRTSGAGDR
jgi:hypothetical protein